MQAVSVVTQSVNLAPQFVTTAGIFLKNHLPTIVTGTIGGSVLLAGTFKVIDLIRYPADKQMPDLEKALVHVKDDPADAAAAKTALEKVAEALKPHKDHGKVESAIKRANQSATEVMKPQNKERINELVRLSRNDIKGLQQRTWGPGKAAGMIFVGAFFIAAAVLVHRYMQGLRTPAPLPVDILPAAVEAATLGL